MTTYEAHIDADHTLENTDSPLLSVAILGIIFCIIFFLSSKSIAQKLETTSCSLIYTEHKISEIKVSV